MLHCPMVKWSRSRESNIFRHPGLWDRQEVPARPSLISCSGGLAQSSRALRAALFFLSPVVKWTSCPTQSHSHISTHNVTTDQQFVDVFKIKYLCATLKCKSCHFADLKWGFFLILDLSLSRFVLFVCPSEDFVTHPLTCYILDGFLLAYCIIATMVYLRLKVG